LGARAVMHDPLLAPLRVRVRVQAPRPDPLLAPLLAPPVLEELHLARVGLRVRDWIGVWAGSGLGLQLVLVSGLRLGLGLGLGERHR
jgi:hypothetical protein